MRTTTSLSEFIAESTSLNPEDAHHPAQLLNDISRAGNKISKQINIAGLTDILGDLGNVNVQGEIVKKLDLFANDTFIQSLRSISHCAAIVSEENEEIIVLNDTPDKEGEFLFCLDPLDGSSNIDVNISVGTIFSVYRRTNSNKKVTKEEFFVQGNEQVMAGYIIYSSSTMLVFTTGNGVNGFTLEPSTETFYLSHPDIKTPTNGEIFSINEGNDHLVPEGVRRYTQFCHETSNGKRTHTARFMGSLVADFHRNMLKGGIYIYPTTAAAPNGRLRLLYECAPLAWIIEQAGGKASDGFERILDIRTQDLHQRVPLFIGSSQMVEKAEQYMLNH